MAVASAITVLIKCPVLPYFLSLIFKNVAYGRGSSKLLSLHIDGNDIFIRFILLNEIQTGIIMVIMI